MVHPDYENPTDIWVRLSTLHVLSCAISRFHKIDDKDVDPDDDIKLGARFLARLLLELSDHEQIEVEILTLHENKGPESYRVQTPVPNSAKAWNRVAVEICERLFLGTYLRIVVLESDRLSWRELIGSSEKSVA